LHTTLRGQRDNLPVVHGCTQHNVIGFWIIIQMAILECESRVLSPELEKGKLGCLRAAKPHADTPNPVFVNAVF